MKATPLELILKLVAKYGLILVLVYFSQLLSPDFSQKGIIMDLDLSATQAYQSSGNIIKQLFLLLSAAAYSYLFITSRTAIAFLKNQRKLITYFLAIFAICFISGTWSKFSGMTFKRTIVQICIFISIFGSVYFSFQQETFDKCIKYTCFIFIAMSLYSIAIGTGFTGVTFRAWADSKNTFGAISFMMLFMISVSHYYRTSSIHPLADIHSRKKILRDTLIIGIPIYLCLLLSQSKTCVALSILFLMSLIFKKLPLKTIFITTGIIMLSVFIIPVFFQNSFGEVLNISNIIDEEALTGRGVIWGALYPEFNNPKNFFLGQGYGTYFGTGKVPEPFDIKFSFLQYINSAHNGYLELALQLGVILAIGVIATLFVMARNLKFKPSITMCWLILIYNVTESAIVRDEHALWITYLLAIAVGTVIHFFESKYKQHQEYEEIIQAQLQK
ncbi:MAG TPA: hypothetical protein DHW71_02165 [Gammaproteobacteria bacterium]|nr:hypothetical protein [Gammaproteobacteria bacterium]HCK91759.1 hypothetical protein [Gammaproteobacteria bacterium]|tara:strand:+ start:438 stop:1769 length:1332 start_codon:yes stop_codon:yes gene_type:complete